MIINRLKIWCPFFVCFLLFFGCTNQEKYGELEESIGFEISGHLDNIPSETIYLLKAGDYLGYTFEKVDSSNVVDGKFGFIGKINAPEMYYLSTKNNITIPFFIENTEINIKGDLNNLGNVMIAGSRSQDIITKIEPQIDSLKEDSEKWEIIRSFIEQNNKSSVAPYLILSYISNLANYEDLKSFYDLLAPQLHNYRYTLRIEDQIIKLEAVRIGHMSPNFVLKDTSGVEFNLSSLRGSYVLIDFWASWCGPCREENPAMVELYNKLKDEKVDFEILGVAADFAEDRWKNAIIKDKLPWINVSDVKGFDGNALKLFGIKSIPYTVLLNKEGKIIEKGLTGVELRNKLREILNF